MKQLLLPISFLFLLIMVTLLMPMPVDKVVFLDVGQGDAILMQYQTTQVLIDGGKGKAVLPRLAKEMPWFDRTIEVIILTHPDQDHLEGLLHVLDQYEVKLVLLPQIPHTTKLQAEWLTKLKNALENEGVEYRFAWQGQKIRVGELSLSILAPFDNGSILQSNQNDASVITRVDIYDYSFLLTGDAERKAENMLLQAYKGEGVLDVNIFQVGHHGSNTSTYEPFIQEVSPDLAVISVGANNQYGHPHPLVLERLNGIPIWRTDLHGSVRFILEERQLGLSLGN